MSKSKNCSDAELLRRSAHDRQAFARFYRRHERLMVGFFMSRTGNPELAADLTAETFASVLEVSERFDSSRGGGTSAVPWMLSIARHTLSASVRRGVVADRARRRLECEPVVLDDAALSRVEEMASVDRRLTGLLDELPTDLREALVARVLEERDYGEIAAELDCSELVVRKRVSRGLLRLRAALSSSNP
jgi:RNA polymerase sigma-70 factor (ECF subfamily)